MIEESHVAADIQMGPMMVGIEHLVFRTVLCAVKTDHKWQTGGCWNVLQSGQQGGIIVSQQTEQRGNRACQISLHMAGPLHLSLIHI